VRTDRVEWDWGIRLARVGVGALRSLHDGDFAEVYASTRPNPLRVIVRADLSLPEDVIVVDGEAWRDLGLTEESRLLCRRVDAYAGGEAYPPRRAYENPVPGRVEAGVPARDGSDDSERLK
jgi:hypothetical protein